MRRGIFLNLAALALALAGSSAWGLDGSGRVSVGDGDSLTLAGESIRLHGIDAPELSQTCQGPRGKVWRCGQWARSQLREIVAQAPLRCIRRDTDRYGRTIATCTAGGQDVAALMVARGAAVAFTRFSDDYVSQERAAKAARRGLWAGSFQRPEDYRAKASIPEVPQPVSATGCVIKGNISKSGHIYHVPGQAFYAKTQIDTAKGERWFCTEAEARAAGWRKAQR